jgi:hypothetical protein
MPESVTDRPTKAHEYVFLLSKSERYFYDAAAIAEPVQQGRPVSSWDARKANGEPMRRGDPGLSGHVTRTATLSTKENRNARTVWSIVAEPCPEAHFAVYPSALPRRCILAGSKPGDTVLDPFAGSGTTGRVAVECGRNATLIELNPEYVTIANVRTAQTGLGP